MDYSQYGGGSDAPGGIDYGNLGMGSGRRGGPNNLGGGPNAPTLPAEKLFHEYNKKRIQIATQISPQKSPIAIHLVPLLLHFNNSALPGYVESPDGCGGIALFEWSEEMKQTAAYLIKDYKSVERDLQQARVNTTRIESVLLMGSVGSSAQSAGSDFDYWVVVDGTKVPPKDLDNLQKKLVAVEQWADKQGAEVHFFITDLNKVKVNDFGKVDKESAGSSQARLLKEEFYRTCILVAGKRPLWWLTPPGISDEEYENAIKKLATTPNFRREMYIDLGNISTIGAEEIFGAALWQINKAMESPYKSVMKIALLESFIDAQGDSTLLCDELKKNILAQSKVPKDMDPYLLMINRLLSLYERKNRSDVVDLIRKCFYNKVKVKLTPAIQKKQTPSFKEEVMIRYIAEWGWDESKVALLNDYENWDFDTTLKLGSELHQFLIETYKSVTDTVKAMPDSKSNISESDLTVLGRKLFSFYSRRPGKIEPIKRASDEGLRQESVTFMPVIQHGKKPVWTCYRGNVSTEIARKANVEYAAIRKSTSLAELICWLTVNMVIDGGTFLHLVTNPCPVHLKTIQDLVKMINDFMPHTSISALKNEALLGQPEITGMLVAVNFASQTWAKEMEELTVLYSNSHGEKFVETLEPKTAPLRLVALASSANISAVMHPLNFFRLYIPKSENSVKFEKMVRTLIMSKIKKSTAPTQAT